MPLKNFPPEQGAHSEALADLLSQSADQIHARVMKAIRQRPLPGSVPPARSAPDQGIDQTTAEALFESELMLRQRANQLYVQAAASAVPGLALSRQNLTDLSESARRKIAKITVIGDLLEVAADLGMLAAAVEKGQAAAASKALKKLVQRGAAL
jgi:hypothetical protein